MQPKQHRRNQQQDAVDESPRSRERVLPKHAGEEAAAAMKRCRAEGIVVFRRIGRGIVMPWNICDTVGMIRSSGILLVPLLRRVEVRSRCPTANSIHDNTIVVIRFGFACTSWKLTDIKGSSPGSGQIAQKPAGFRLLQLALRGHLHVRRIETQPDPVLLALHASVRIPDRDIVNRTDVLCPAIRAQSRTAARAPSSASGRPTSRTKRPLAAGKTSWSC